MKKINRLKKNEEFSNIINKKHKVYNNSFTLYYDLKVDGNIKVGISVSKKHFKTAVIRNRIKRQVREMVREIFPIETKMHLVIIVSKNYINYDYMTNKENLLWLSKKILAR